MKSRVSRLILSMMAGCGLIALGVFGLGSPVLANGVAEEAASANKPYTVECERNEEGRRVSCTVDQDTFVGWRTFGGNCAQCHGQDAVGSSFAPNLIRSMDNMTEEQFYAVLENGQAGGQMPGFAENPNVWRHKERLYGYLRARADGELIGGRPARFDQ